MKKIISFILMVCTCFSMGILLISCDNSCEHSKAYRTLKSTTATCTEAGVETYYCKNCGENEETVNVEAYGHSFGNSVYDGKNLINSKCKRCNELMFTMEGLEDLPATVETQAMYNGGKSNVSTMRIESVAYSIKSVYMEFFITFKTVGDCIRPDFSTTPYYYFGYKYSIKDESGAEVGMGYTLPFEEGEEIGYRNINTSIGSDGTVTVSLLAYLKDDITDGHYDVSWDYTKKYTCSFQIMRSVCMNYNTKAANTNIDELYSYEE